jgi:AAHS family cis,cis-muconate transporter-like MFS transporter
MEANIEKKQPLLTKLLLLFMVAMVFANISGSMIGSMLTLFLKSLDASVEQVGLFFTLASILPLILQILGGWISDRFGRLRSIAWGSSIGVLSYIGYIFAPTWQWVLACEGLGSITRSLVGPSFSSFIAEQSSEENRARVYGITDTIFTIVVVIGPPIAGWIVDRFGFRMMLLGASLLYVLATALRIWMARQSYANPKSDQTEKHVINLKKDILALGGLFLAGGVLTWLLLTDGVRDIAYSTSFNLMPLYLSDIGGISAQQIGWLNSFYGIACMVIKIPAGWLSDKTSERFPIALGYGCIAGAVVLFIYANTFFGYAISWCLLGLGDGIMTPAYLSLMSKALPEKQRGLGFGLLQSSLGIFSLPAPAIGAMLWEKISPRFPFQLTVVISLLVIIPVWFKFKIPKKVGSIEAAADGGVARQK